MKQQVICGIYKITSPSGKIYIGQSKNCLQRERVYKCNGCKGQIKVYRSIKKYGWDKHSFEILHTCQYNELDDLEIYYIKLFQSDNPKSGLNIRGGGYSHSSQTKESKEKISKTKKSQNLTGSKSARFGVKHLEKSKKQMSDIKKNKKRFGENNKNSKLILNTETGIYYYSARKALESLSIQVTISRIGFLHNKLTGARKNNTPFIYA